MSSTTTPPLIRSKLSAQGQSLQWRLASLLAWMLLVTLLVIGASVFLFISKNEQITWQGRQREAARYAGQAVASFIQRIQDTLSLVSLLERETLEADAQVMGDFLKQNPALLELVRVDGSGHVFASAYQDEPLLATQFTINQSGWFLDAKAGKLYLGALQISGDNEPYAIMASPATDGSVVAARLRMNLLWDVVANIGFGESGQAYVINQQGQIIAHTKPEVALARTSIAGRAEMAALLQAPNLEWGGSYVNLEGSRVVGVTAPVPGTQWIVVTELPQSEAYAISRSALILLGGGLSILGALMVWVTNRFFLRRLIAQPIEILRAGAELIGRGDLTHRINIDQQDEVGHLAGAFNRMAAELQELYRQNAAHTQNLERRAVQLKAAAEVGRIAASSHDLDTLLPLAARLISERFGFYHTGVFLLDEAGEYAVLRAANSEGGQRMLARGHRLKVGEQGIVGYATGKGEPRIALDVGADAVYFNNPDMPDTRSEMALPLIAGGRVLGALDVQSTEEAAFTEEDITVLQVLADQVAVAIDNARLFAQSEEALEATRRAYGELSQQAWKEALAYRPNLGYVCDAQDLVRPVTQSSPIEPIEIQAAGHSMPPSSGHSMPCSSGHSMPHSSGHSTFRSSGQAQEATNNGHTVAIPLKIRDQVLGMVRLRKPDDAGGWSADEKELVESLAEQLGTALESARLYQDTQRRAARERLAREITDQVRRATTPESIIQTAVDALFQVLGTSRAFGQLHAASPRQEHRSDKE